MVVFNTTFNNMKLRKFITVSSLSISTLGMLILPLNSNFSNTLISIGLGSFSTGNVVLYLSDQSLKKIDEKFLKNSKAESDLIECRLKLKILSNNYDKILNQFESIKFDKVINLIESMVKNDFEKIGRLIHFKSKKYDLKIENTFNSHFKKTLNELNNLKLSPSIHQFEPILKIVNDYFNESNNFKIIVYKNLIKKFEKQLSKMVSEEIHYKEIDNLKKNFDSFKREFSQLGENLVFQYENDFKEIVTAGNFQLERLKTLEIQLEKSEQPILFSGVYEGVEVGNLLIKHFLKCGIKLDAFEINENKTGYELIFSTARNRQFVTPEKLNIGDLPVQIKHLSNSLNEPKFELKSNDRVFLKIIKRQELLKTDFSRMIVPATKFGITIDNLFEKKPTLRVCGSTGSGKSIFVKSLLKYQLDHRPDYQFGLCDPVSNSSQDYWNLPKMAKNKEETFTKIDEFLAEFEHRKCSKNQDFKNIVLILDEIDKTLDKDYKSKLSKIWTEIRHYQMKLILIGQSSEVSKNGWLWDDMLNCSMIFLGESIKTALKHCKDLGFSDSTSKILTTQFDSITEHFNDLNQKLTQPYFHRLCLVVTSGRSPFFVEIPSFSDSEFLTFKPVQFPDSF